MGIFSFFSKEKKETLDKGLSKTKENVFSKITRAIAGKSKVDDEVLDNLEEVLITSDVGVDTTLKIISRIEDRVARDKYVTTSELTAILREEIGSGRQEAVCHYGRRRERGRQDDHDRQTGLSVQEGR